MATQSISLFNAHTMPKPGGDVFWQPMGAVFDTASPLHNPQMLVFKNPPAADIFLDGKFDIPENYVGSPVVRVRFATVAGSASLLGMGFRYTVRTGTESWDMSTADEDDVTTQAGSATARTPAVLSFTALTAANFTAGDDCFFGLYRDNSEDTIGADVFIMKAIFEYSDV